ncbi:DUF4226 domain-containing protein [Mycolicibacterium sp. CH28]|uniref:DUF4226 domain-containing protein n=1 Tax=Mycolicibacterium sp. CH28 TaxID=2512237 RepID=UPI001081298D|nr:DUF4226 domain-containing protein [Mycolicibacterium sp. CH28]TGD90041.1 DUF4226 domain-containing protein [Mycolicibacterium sp. CH28]
MAEHVAAAGEALEASRSALAARDRELAEADAELASVLASVHAAAVEAIGRLDRVSTEIESAVAHQLVAAPHEGREFARFLLDKHREIIDIVTVTRADAGTKAIALQHLQDRYRVTKPL